MTEKPILPFYATVNGTRSRFIKVEHSNIGEGWNCIEIDGKFPKREGFLSGSRTFHTNEMTEIVEIDPSDAAAELSDEFKGWKIGSGEITIKNN